MIRKGVTLLYKQIEQNKRNTWIVLGLFMLLLIAISVFLGCIWIPIGVIFFIAGIIYIAVVYFDASKHLLKLTGAQEITKESNPEIYEIVEELCLAANIPIPSLYIAPTTEVNAFATGIDPEHASLVLYQGLLRYYEQARSSRRNWFMSYHIFVIMTLE